jgi:hypothetical protein
VVYVSSLLAVVSWCPPARLSTTVKAWNQGCWWWWSSPEVSFSSSSSSSSNCDQSWVRENSRVLCEIVVNILIYSFVCCLWSHPTASVLNL